MNASPIEFLLTSLTPLDSLTKMSLIVKGAVPHFSYKCLVTSLIGERSKPPSDKLGGEIFISSRMLVCLSLYLYGVVRPDN